MKRTIQTRHLPVMLLVLLSALLFGFGCSDDSTSAPNTNVLSNSFKPGDQSAELEADLLQLREEEKLARDVYLTLYDKWQIDIFQNISRSEQNHMDKVGALLTAFGITDPIVDNSVGVFTDENLAGLYETLVAQGMQSKVQALLVGATIEDLDIFDIREMRSHTDISEVIATYDKLECGSNNHLVAFTGQLKALDTEYVAQFLTADEIEAIISAGQQSCGGGNGGRNGGGKGGGHGGGNGGGNGRGGRGSRR